MYRRGYCRCRKGRGCSRYEKGGAISGRGRRREGGGGGGGGEIFQVMNEVLISLVLSRLP